MNDSDIPRYVRCLSVPEWERQFPNLPVADLDHSGYVLLGCGYCDRSLVMEKISLSRIKALALEPTCFTCSAMRKTLTDDGIAEGGPLSDAESASTGKIEPSDAGTFEQLLKLDPTNVKSIRVLPRGEK